tara:strand:- start:6909 stop:10433 length:3525 start_codon:yes stop_codon:yes gene_type:complete
VIKSSFHKYIPVYSIVVFLFACNKPADNTLFQKLDSSDTGIDFANQLTESDTFNIVDFDYIYNGSGVGIADLNGDGLPELFFGGNQISSRLYLNSGDFKFKDVTEKSQISTQSWIEGVTFTDINGDGRLDIYLSVSNRNESVNPNLLFVNQGNDENGIPLFEEKAAEYGLNAVGYFTQAAFFDFDKDGDLDCYLLANALESFQRNISRPRITDGSGKSNDFLLRNDGEGQFVAVTNEAGITYEGYGLGLTITDVNQDGWPDIYVANDFLTNDVLYINQQDGTFQNEIQERIDHQSFNAMGVDAGDINGDGWPDLVVVDMFPPDNLRQKTMFSPTENYNLYQANLSKGYEPQYVRNTLQLNRGDGTFAEIGELAGISQTDWSWSPLYADFDMDGMQDLIISNGYGKDITDMDYINYTNNLGPFMTPEDKKKLRMDGLNLLKEVKLNNYAFRNTGNLTFEDVSGSWGIDGLGISNGMAFGDLDGDGDLDLVTNNLNDIAGVFRNNKLENASKDTTVNWLKIKLQGSPPNPLAIGAEVRGYLNENGSVRILSKTMHPSKGYKSAMFGDVIFGLGNHKSIDSLVVIWPDGTHSKMGNTVSNQNLTLSQESSGAEFFASANVENSTYEEVSAALGINYVASAVSYNDFNRQGLLPIKHSSLGPGIAVGDVDGDGLDDFYLSGSVGHPGRIFTQKRSGDFISVELEGSGISDEMGSLLFDADGDDDLDLYVVSGGSRYDAENELYQDVLYINTGGGNFQGDSLRLPKLLSSGSVVTAADFDQDGDLDLFIGGRVKPGRYPESPKSFLLENRAGIFVDVTVEFAAGLSEVGMVSAALWTDYNQDGSLDLLVSGEWMPVTVFLQTNEGGKRNFTAEVVGSESWKSDGWWNSIYPMTFEDGEMPNYSLGNVGENSRYRALQKKPLEIHFADFDKNGSVDPVIFQYFGDTIYPLASRNQLVGQVPKWKNKFLIYREFAYVGKDQFFSPEEKDMALTLQAHEFRSGVLRNLGDSVHFNGFPQQAQFSRIFGMLEIPEGIFAVGNFHGNETVTGRNDAGRGALIKAKNELYQSFEFGRELGLEVPGESRAVAKLMGADGREIVLVSRYNQSLLAFRSSIQSSKVIQPAKDDQFLLIYRNGKPTMKRELFYGSGYLSQSTRKLTSEAGVDSVVSVNYKGMRRRIDFN